MKLGRRPSNEVAKSVAVRAAAVVLWLVIWQLASMAVGQALILPGPVEVLAAICRLVPTVSFWTKVGFSAARIICGMLAACALALILAAASKASNAVRVLARPPLLAMKATPVVCVVVLLLIWLGASYVSVAAVFLMVLPAVYFPSLEGLSQASTPMRELMDVHDVRGLKRVLAYWWPELLPYLVATGESVVGMSWKAGVAAELIGMPAGSIGERIYQAKLLLETGDLFAWTIVVIALAALSERAFLALLRGSAAAAISAAVRMHGAVRESAESSSCPSRGEGAACEVLGAKDLLLPHGAAAGKAVSFSLGSGGRMCVFAKSGAGKTTLLRVLAGLEDPVAGTAVSPGRISMVFQEPRLVENASALDNVLLMSAPDISADDAGALLHGAIPEVDPATRASELSGGQRRRVEIVRALCAPGEAVLLDEPFAGLDAAAKASVCKLVLNNLNGRALLVATHDEADARALGASVFELPEA